ncbi:MAG: hypothetical protein R2715_25185 [Ilumatobacteraceae bacterium]
MQLRDTSLRLDHTLRSLKAACDDRGDCLGVSSGVHHVPGFDRSLRELAVHLRDDVWGGTGFTLTKA